MNEVETHSIEAEQGLLGTVLMYPDALTIIDGLVEPDHFFEPVHRTIFGICQQLHQAGKRATPVTILPFLPANTDVAQGMTARQYVARLAAEATTLLNAGDYAKIIRDMSDARELEKIGRSLKIEPGADPIETANFAMDAISDLLSTREITATAGVNMDDAAVRAIDRAAAAYQNEGATTGIPFGFPDLDTKTLGAQKGELIILAGRPGQGKTTLALAVAKNMANEGRKIRIESLEMDDVSLTHRLIADEMYDDYRMTYNKMRSGRFHEDEFTAMADAAKRVGKMPIRIEQPVGLTMPQLSARVRQWKRRHGLDVLIVDHLGYIKLPNRGNQVSEIGEVTKGFKSLARELGIPVILLCQLSRGVDSREDKRPTLSDLRASGNIEEDADMVIMVYREAYYLERREPKPGTPEHLAWQENMETAVHKMQAIVEKQRNGPIGAVQLYCDIGCNAIRSISYQPTGRRVYTPNQSEMQL